jgi:hypothetical protein
MSCALLNGFFKLRLTLHNAAALGARPPVPGLAECDGNGDETNRPGAKGV